LIKRKQCVKGVLFYNQDTSVTLSFYNSDSTLPKKIGMRTTLYKRNAGFFNKIKL